MTDSAENATAEETEQPRPKDEWLFLPDPSWRPENEDDRPPLELVVGMWIVSADGVTGPFQGNPDYRPPDPASPTDPADAAMRVAVMEDPPDTETVLRNLRGVLLGVALDDEGQALVASLPDDVEAVLVTTAPVHREHVEVPGWQDVLIWELADALPEGVDLMVNPGAPVSMHLQRDTVRDALAAAESEGSGD
ncbi:type VII secretion system-associated protein [Saccharopolyspora sp. 5N708]|uniref:type VII secretion system-associated protein n=1 Tax=Saccharopolyspora sp. 5N708 TaxID=3457424 RepID=UPI003FD3FA94